MKNRKRANLILAVLIIIFILLAVLKHYLGEIFIIRMMIFIVEAALVGSIADWFAVTALFEKPLGLPIRPIVPSNREKILNNLTLIINNNLLDMDYVQNSIKKMPIGQTLVDMVENKSIIHEVQGFLLSQAFKIIENFKNDKAKFLNYLKNKTKDIHFIKTKIISFINDFIKKKFTKEVLSSLLDKAIELLNKAETREKLYIFLDAKISAKAGTRLSIFGGVKTFADVGKLTSAIQSEGTDFLMELKTTDEIYNELKILIDKFSKERLMKADLQNMLENFIDKFLTEERLDKLLTKAEIFLSSLFKDGKEASKDKREAIADIVKELIEDLWKAIKNDADTLNWIDSLIKGLIIEIIAANRMEFSKFIEERIKGFTNDQLSDLIENSAGEPLHWIRINGAMLGALLGIVLFSFINFLYDPFIIPIAHRFIGII
ncbi:MAG: DUF445 family protein [Bacillota bacterium]|nr:DUF445 family protein [Bacillota bacterium]